MFSLEEACSTVIAAVIVHVVTVVATKLYTQRPRSREWKSGMRMFWRNFSPRANTKTTLFWRISCSRFRTFVALHFLVRRGARAERRIFHPRSLQRAETRYYYFLKWFYPGSYQNPTFILLDLWSFLCCRLSSSFLRRTQKVFYLDLTLLKTKWKVIPNFFGFLRKP